MTGGLGTHFAPDESTAEGLRSVQSLPSNVRRFLLLEKPRLGGGITSLSVMFYSILITPDDTPAATAHMMHLTFSLGEMIAILSGLSIALPISLRAATGYDVTDWANAPAWNAAVNLGSTAVTSLLFLSIITSCVASIFSALGTRFRGPDAVDYYSVICEILGLSLIHI